MKTPNPMTVSSVHTSLTTESHGVMLPKHKLRVVPSVDNLTMASCPGIAKQSIQWLETSSAPPSNIHQ